MNTARENDRSLSMQSTPSQAKSDFKTRSCINGSSACFPCRLRWEQQHKQPSRKTYDCDGRLAERNCRHSLPAIIGGHRWHCAPVVRLCRHCFQSTSLQSDSAPRPKTDWSTIQNHFFPQPNFILRSARLSDVSVSRV